MSVKELRQNLAFFRANILDAFTHWRCPALSNHRGPRRLIMVGHTLRLIQCEACCGGWLEPLNGGQRVWLGKRAFMLTWEMLK